jgi:hypothetical protein
MKPNTITTYTRSRSQGRRHREPTFGKTHIALAVALLASLAASAQAQSEGSDEPHHVILPVRTRVIGADPKGSCNQYSVEVNGNSYHCTDGLLSGFNIVSFNRVPVTDADGWPTLKLYDYKTIHTDAGALKPVKDYLDLLLDNSKAPKDLLIIVSSLGRDGGPLWDIAPELEKFGATKEFESIGYPDFTFSFVGIKNAKIGEGYQVGGDGIFKGNMSSWSLNGYLATDSSGKYAFFQPDYVQFGLDPARGKITIGAEEYTTPGSNGIRVRVVDRANPENMYSDNVYAVGGLPEDLGQKGEGELYLIVSVGDPFSTSASDARARDALKLARLGGTYELYANARAGDTYCLVGAASPAGGLPRYSAAEEGSLEGDDLTGPFRGALGRGRRGNFFSPVASASQQTNFDFYSILAQKPIPFPHPAPGNDAEQQAFDCIGERLIVDRNYDCTGGKLKLCQACNPRDGYWNTSVDIDAWKSTLESLDTDPFNPSVDCDDPPGEAKTKTAYCVVRGQLLMEFTYVGNIRKFNANISELWGKLQSQKIFSLLTIGQEIQKELDANAKKPTSGIVENLLNYVLLAGTYIPEVGRAFGVAYAAFSFGETLANNDVGDSLVSDVNSTVAGLEEQAVDSFNAQEATVGTMFRFIYQDWGKIEALGVALNAGGDWAWNGDTTTGQILERMKYATRASYYRSILPTLYALGQLDDVTSPDPANAYHNGYEPDYPHPYCYPTHPFKEFDTVQYVSSRAVDDLKRWHVEPIGLIDQGGGKTCHTDPSATGDHPYKSLSPTILKKIFTDVKVYQPDFYRHWEFPRVKCDRRGNSLDIDDFSYSTGCKWKTAAFSTEASESAVSAASRVNSSPQFKSAVSAPSSTNSSQIEAEAVTFPEEAASSLSYSWQVLGGNAEILDGDTATPTIYFISGPGSYVVRVTMADAAGNSWQSETTVHYQEQ